MIVKDCIYRFIKVPSLCEKFIDTPEFQRLRRVRQLGLVPLVYPSVTHTRFEHSLGVMHLAGKAYDSVVENSRFTPKQREKELVMLAGLMHDVGHKAFSHMYDDVLESLSPGKLENHHEVRSINTVQSINNRIKVLEKDEVELAQRMILGDEGWIYQIVNNKICDIDVDKMDYLQRDAYHTGMPGFQSDYIINNMYIDRITILLSRTRLGLR